MGELVFSPHAYTMLNGGTACGTPMRRKGAAMAELSLCMIVKNEEARLARCLKSVCGAVDEIIILDTGSTDATKAIAREFTPSVYDYAWDDDFAAARNTSFAYATRPFILWLDADDVLESSEREKLIALKRRLTADVDAVMMPYHTGFGADGKPSLIYERERIIRRDAGFRFSGVVHEAMAVSGHVLHADIIIRHERGEKPPQGRRNLDIYEKWMARGRAMSARDRYYYAREWMALGDYAAGEREFARFLAMPEGWKENRIDAYIQRGICLQRLGRRGEAKQSCLASLAIAPPRAEALCVLGELEMQEEAWQAAVFWYRAALLCGKPTEGGAFISPDVYGYIPALQLCVCYDRLGRIRQASQMNERALLEKPGDAVALENRKYFEKRLFEQTGGE